MRWLRRRPVVLAVPTYEPPRPAPAYRNAVSRACVYCGVTFVVPYITGTPGPDVGAAELARRTVVIHEEECYA